MVSIVSACKSPISGFPWSDVDLATGRASIERALTYDAKGAPCFGPPKTASSVRVVVLPEPVLDRLRRHRAALGQRLLSGGVRTELIFANGAGEPIRYNDLRRAQLKHLFAAAGLKDATPYALRHSAASLLLAGGTSPAEVAQQARQRPGHLVRVRSRPARGDRADRRDVGSRRARVLRSCFGSRTPAPARGESLEHPRT